MWAGVPWPPCGLPSTGPSASLYPPFLPLLLLTLFPQTPNPAFPHLCAFAQAALLPPVNPDFSFMAPPQVPLPHTGSPSPAWGGARWALSLCMWAHLRVGEAMSIPDHSEGSQRIGSESCPTVGHPGPSRKPRPNMPSPQHRDSGTRCLPTSTPKFSPQPLTPQMAAWETCVPERVALHD